MRVLVGGFGRWIISLEIDKTQSTYRFRINNNEHRQIFDTILPNVNIYHIKYYKHGYWFGCGFVQV